VHEGVNWCHYMMVKGSFEDTYEFSVLINTTTILDQWSDFPGEHGAIYIIVIKIY
jgi:hypothetical protein